MMTRTTPTAGPLKTALVWLDGKAPDCATDRGWLHALCEPWSQEQRYGYTNDTMPVRDDRIGWREQSSVGCYLDYGPLRTVPPTPPIPLSPLSCGVNQALDAKQRHAPEAGHVHAVCYWTSASRYCLTVKDAKTWMLREAATVRSVHVQEERPL